MVNPVYIQITSENAQSYGKTKKRNPDKENPDGKLLQKVDFDIAVYVEAGKQGSAGAKLSIVSIGIGAEGQINSNNKSESRIKFSIPVVFPGFENEH